MSAKCIDEVNFVSEDIPNLIRDSMHSSFDVIFAWGTERIGAFKTEDIVYHNYTGNTNWKYEAYHFWQNTQFVIYKMFEYEASFITMVYGELLHDCVLHVETQIGDKESILTSQLEDNSFLIQIVITKDDIFDDSLLFSPPPQSDTNSVKLFDLVSFGYKMAKNTQMQLSNRMIQAIKRFSNILAQKLASFLNVEEGNEVYHLIEEISLMLVSYGYPSTTFRTKCFSLYNQKAYSSNQKNYSSGGKFVIWRKPIVSVLVRESEYKLWMKTLKLDALSRTIVNLLSLSRYHSTRSAIGSIMSRNGSHNIGSHVLAALSHNVGTMPDDQMLYRYIQHRMDYIATATTERPSWCQPTKFVGEMMKRFLSQRHLLNYISRSEGLKAWEFQSDRAKSEHGGRIKLHIRKEESGGYFDFINYDALETPIDLSKDVTLAIPGGIIGQHSFFTILENIIRNAAKHDWSTPPSSTACLKDWPLENSIISATEDKKLSKNNRKKPSTGDLDIYIDFKDEPEMKDVLFTIWSRLSDVNDENIEDNQPLHKRQQIELGKEFITEQGELRRENWGLAEMKISAGYLQKAKIEDIGGIGDSDAGSKIIVPCCVDDSKANDGELETKVEHLGYQFAIPKARNILFVVSQIPEALKTDIESELLKNGIYVKTKDKISKDTSFNYAYVVMDSFPTGDERRRLPFRVLAMSEPQNNKEQDAKILSKAETQEIIRPLLGNEPSSCEMFLSKIIEEAGKDIDKISVKLIEEVCGTWVRYLLKMRDLGKDGVVPIYINTVGKKSGAGKSLVTDLDIVEYAFNEGIGGALTAFKSIGKNADKALSFVSCLLDLKNSPQGNLLVFNRDGWLEFIKGNSEVECDRVAKNTNEKTTSGEGCDREEESNRRKVTSKESRSREAIIKWQLSAWLTEWEMSFGQNGCGIDIKNAINYLQGLSDSIVDIDKKIDDLKAARSTYSDGDLYMSLLETYLTEKATAERSLNSPIIYLVNYLKSYCDQVEGFICKYAETIATLPEGFSKDIERQNWINEWMGVYFEKDSLESQEKTSPLHLSKGQIRYWRHETERKTEPPFDLYLEGLSGTQSYLNVLERLSKNDRLMQTRLLENALLRILIVDERTREFLEKHPSMFATFDALGIDVVNDKKVYEELEKIEKETPDLSTKFMDDLFKLSPNDIFSPKEMNCLVDFSPKILFYIRQRLKGRVNDESSKERMIKLAYDYYWSKYEVIIIHQGIIDKWLPGASHDEAIVAGFIDNLEKVFRYVVITTGRGTPANIPTNGRVLPFSTIQTTLFSQHPEKLLLTDAIMNILPVKEEKNG